MKMVALNSESLPQTEIGQLYSGQSAEAGWYPFV